MEEHGGSSGIVNTTILTIPTNQTPADIKVALAGLEQNAATLLVPNFRFCLFCFC